MVNTGMTLWYRHSVMPNRLTSIVAALILGCVSPGQRSVDPSTQGARGIGAQSSTEYGPMPRAPWASSATEACPGCASVAHDCGEAQLPADNGEGSAATAFSVMLSEQQQGCALPQTDAASMRGWEAFVGTCADGKRFLSQYETFEGETLARFYRDEQLVGVVKRSYMSAGACDGWWRYGSVESVTCEVSRIERLCQGAPPATAQRGSAVDTSLCEGHPNMKCAWLCRHPDTLAGTPDCFEGGTPDDAESTARSCGFKCSAETGAWRCVNEQRTAAEAAR